MLAFISLLMPPFLLWLLREILILRHKKIGIKVVWYAGTVFMLNLVAVFIVRYLFGSDGNTIMKLTQYRIFALKYLILSSIIAITEPFAELFIKRKMVIRKGKETEEPISLKKELYVFFVKIRLFLLVQYRMQKKWMRDCVRGFGARDWKIFKAVFTVAFLTHIFVFTNHLVNYDSVWSIYGMEDVVTSGRWFLKYAAGIGSYFRLPWVNGLLSILYISLSAVIVAQYLEIRNVWLSILAGVTLAVYPSVALTFNFMYTADAYFLAMLMAVLAAWLICMDQWLARILGGLLVGISMGIYQAYLSVTLVLLLLWLIKHALIKGEPVAKYVCGMAASLVFAAGFYTLEIKNSLAGGQLDSYQGIAESTLLHPLAWYAKRFIGSSQDIAQMFVSDAFESGYARTAIIVVWSVTTIKIVYYIVCVARKKQLASVIYGCLGIVMIPIAVYCLKLLSDGVWYYRLMLESIAFVWLLPVIVLDESLMATVHSNRWNKIVSFLVLGSLLCNLWNYVVVDNISYFASSLANKKTYALAERILDRIEQTERYEEAEYVYFYGNIEKSEYEDVRFLGKSVIGNSIIPNSGVNYAGYIRNFLGIRYEILDSEEQIEEIRKSEEFQKMPIWPSVRCTELIGDVIVVKLGKEN